MLPEYMVLSQSRFRTLNVEVYLSGYPARLFLLYCFRTLNVEVYQALMQIWSVWIKRCFRTLNVEVYLLGYDEDKIYADMFPYIKC